MPAAVSTLPAAAAAAAAAAVTPAPAPAPAPVSATVQPWVLGTATFDLQTMPTTGLFSTWTGAIVCTFPRPGEADRSAKIATLLNAGVTIKATACAATTLFQAQVCNNAGMQEYWLVEAPGATVEQMKALGFETVKSPTTNLAVGPCK